MKWINKFRLVEDSLTNLLRDPGVYMSYRRKGSLPEKEYLNIIREVEKEQGNIEMHKETEIKEEPVKCIHLSKWTIKLVPSEEGDLWVVLLGAVGKDKEIVQSSFIKKRISAHCIMSKNTKYLLEGPFDETYPPHEHFRESVLSKFRSGFPLQWQSIIKGEVAHILHITQDVAQDTHSVNVTHSVSDAVEHNAVSDATERDAVEKENGAVPHKRHANGKRSKRRR
ncbi:hypothetical protein NEFER03_0763 [Nematocida sp. LUAm3]|nr:hypothetical protein NEFER03_0763 [Nematocida sp. LUAm3]KAI5175222.1 hypothetical protein NEFER02_1183 [Nematocida sp. LUAm2]KAI5178106.1 hypothetical protein NEFER01_1284 [Nematocida sp. LUAm1]